MSLGIPATSTFPRRTNRQLAETDSEFRTACALAGVFPSREQYRKWKYHRGQAYLAAHATTRAELRAIDIPPSHCSK